MNSPSTLAFLMFEQYDLRSWFFCNLVFMDSCAAPCFKGSVLLWREHWGRTPRGPAESLGFSPEKAIGDTEAICLQLEGDPKRRNPTLLFPSFLSLTLSLPFPYFTFLPSLLTSSFFSIHWIVTQCTRDMDMVAYSGALWWFAAKSKTQP